VHTKLCLTYIRMVDRFNFIISWLFYLCVCVCMQVVYYCYLGFSVLVYFDFLLFFYNTSAGDSLEWVSPKLGVMHVKLTHLLVFGHFIIWALCYSTVATAFPWSSVLGDCSNNNNNNNHDNVYGAVIVAVHCHYESSPGSSDECSTQRQVAAKLWTKPIYRQL